MGIEQNKKIQDYINNVCSRIKCREMHEEIKLELEDHIGEMAEEYLAEGFSEDESVNKAIAQMGDGMLVGRQLNKIHKQKPEWSILILTLIFSNLGLLAIYFIEANGIVSYGPSLSMFTKSLVFALFGSAIAIGLYFFDYRKIKPFSWYIYFGTLLILLLEITIGKQVNGIPRLSIGFISLNFVNVSVILFALSLAGIFDGWDWNKPKKILYGLILLGVPVILMVSYPSLSSAAIYSILFVSLMAASGAKLWYVFLIIGSGITMFLFEIFRNPYMVKRFLTFINPGKDPSGAGYLNIQLNKIIESAGFLGQGFTFEPKTMPEVHTDFIFSYIVYTFGWIAGIMLIALIIAFLVRIIRVSVTVKDSYGRLLAGGFGIIFAVQFLWNILMTVSLAPITGVSLPFISYGGSQFIMNMVMVGFILSVYGKKNMGKVLKQLD